MKMEPPWRAEKEWGHELVIVNDLNLDLCGKRMFLKEGYQSSIHWHVRKTEVFYVELGSMKVEYWEKDGKKKYIMLEEGQSIKIEPGTPHRFIGENKNCIFYEFSTYDRRPDSYRLSRSGKI